MKNEDVEEYFKKTIIYLHIFLTIAFRESIKTSKMMIGVWKRLGFKYNEQLNLDIEYAIKEYKKMIKISKAKNLKDSFEKLTEEGRIFGEGFVNLEETLISEINRFLEETEGLTNKEKEMVMLLKPKTSLRNYFARMISGLKLEEFEK